LLRAHAESGFFRTSWQFTSICSPPRIAATQLISVTDPRAVSDGNFHPADNMRFEAHVGAALVAARQTRSGNHKGCPYDYRKYIQLELWTVNRDGDLVPQPPPAKRYACGRHPWAWLLRRVFKEEVTVCPKCQGSMRVSEIVTDPGTIARRLAQAGLGPMPPPKPMRTIPGQLPLQFG
jgi:hypothetical protein